MYSKSLPAMILLLVTGTSAAGQNSLEYGRLPNIPPKVPNPTAKLASRVGDQSNASTPSRVIDVPDNGGKAASGNKSTGAQQPTATTPKPPAVFILSSGERLESDNYTLTHDSVQLMHNGKPRTIRLSSVNVEATLAANKQRGIDLKIPADKSQMTVSF